VDHLPGPLARPGDHRASFGSLSQGNREIDGRENRGPEKIDSLPERRDSEKEMLRPSDRARNGQGRKSSESARKEIDMDIKVLGMGCARCRDLEQRVRKALAETGLAADVEKVDDIQKIMTYRVMATPGLVIDGTVKSSGRLPSVGDIKNWLLETAFQ